jgi:predicted O-methyltransferase YrrM
LERPVEIGENMDAKITNEFLHSGLMISLFNKYDMQKEYVYDYDRKLMNKIKSEKIKFKSLMSPLELFKLYKMVKNISSKLPILEIGTYTGGSAKIMSMATNNNIITIDTFEGLKDVGEFDKDFFYGQFPAAYKNVQQMLSECKNVKVIKGNIMNMKLEGKYSFIHMDVDVYAPAKHILDNYLSCLDAGSFILTHDYMTSMGVRKAVDECKNVNVVWIGGNQAIIIKK